VTNLREIKEPVVIVCEGPSDCNFVKALVERDLLAGIQAICPAEQNEAGGFFAIPKLLLGISASSGWPAVTGLALIVDANGNPEKRFSEAANMLASVNVSVTRPFQVEGGHPAGGIFLMPGPGRTGCLEDLLLGAIEKENPELIACVNSFADCVQSPLGWSANKQAKMRIHSLMAACCEEEPAAALSRVWVRKGNPIPINSSSFSDLLNFLRQFSRPATV